MPRHTVDQWNKHEDVQLSNVRGFSMLEKLPRNLQEAYPHLRDFRFGFCIAETLPDWYAEAWVHLTTEDFPDDDRDALNTALSNKGAHTEEVGRTKKIDDLNDTVRLRFNILADAQGRIKYKENWIMIQPKDYFMKRRNKMHEISERAFQSQVGPKEEDRPGLGKTVSTYEETRVTEKKRGRPPKES